ncbi:MAG: hypothetical protein P9X22_05970 [Candidatus Zapsychrus exili]|nr:hypothetical protein [Candidatus Zapsychrus exili]
MLKKISIKCRENKAQAAVTYLILLAVVLAITLVGLNTYVNRTRSASNVYFDKTAEGIMGKPHPDATPSQ